MGSIIVSPGTKINPKIEFLEDNNQINISGWSFCEKPIDIYQPVFDIVSGLYSNAQEQIVLNFNLTCYNTASSKCIVELVSFLSNLAKKAKAKHTINWVYDKEDEEAREWGEDLMMVSGVDFNFITH